MRTIDADALLMNSIWYLNDIGEECIKVDDIANAPTIEERKTGKWIWREDEKYYDTPTGNATYECSLCNHSDVHAKTQEVPYCWWCGAKMEEKR